MSQSTLFRVARWLTVAVASAVLLAGCGGGAQTDHGGFTAVDRKSAQDALDHLVATNIPTDLVVMTNTAEAAPSQCLVHLESEAKKTFRLLVFWTPDASSSAAYTWLEGTITPNVIQDGFRLLGAREDAPEVKALESHQGDDVFSAPVEQCQLSMDGSLTLLAK